MKTPTQSNQSYPHHAHPPYPSSSPWKQKEWGGCFWRTEGGKQVVDLGNLLMSFVKIDFAQQKCDHSALF
jgi:hypothetical protein